MTLQNIADFWRRWHISLTSWLTDYVFMPLNVKWRDWGKWGMILAIIVNFVVVGLWHDANWTFVVFGLYHGLLYIPLILSGAMLKKTTIVTYKWGFPKLKTLGNMLLTFALVAFGLILVRAESLGQAVDYIAGMFSASLFSAPMPTIKVSVYFLVLMFVIIEWFGRNNHYAIEKLDFAKKRYIRWAIYFAITVLILCFGDKEQQFIYFQF
ncbi:hypothetical protein AGMMS4957_21790 [Bacteroidia bacterium]|nr:hypothetical protein AGMMS4957_21790 [Bacteroidia bacterium]